MTTNTISISWGENIKQVLNRAIDLVKKNNTAISLDFNDVHFFIDNTNTDFNYWFDYYQTKRKEILKEKKSQNDFEKIIKHNKNICSAILVLNKTFLAFKNTDDNIKPETFDSIMSLVFKYLDLVDFKFLYFEKINTNQELITFLKNNNYIVDNKINLNKIKNIELSEKQEMDAKLLLINFLKRNGFKPSQHEGVKSEEFSLEMKREFIYGTALSSLETDSLIPPILLDMLESLK